MKCLETDTLVALGAALEWNTDDVLRHVTSCSQCRARLSQLAAIQSALEAEMQPTRGFTDMVVESVRSYHADHGVRWHWLTGMLNFGLASIAMFFTIALGVNTGGRLPPGPSVLVVCLVTAGATLWWSAAQGAGKSGTLSDQHLP